MTIHKSQGSEYPVVIMLVAEEHGILLEKNLIYTGMTRGKKLVIVIGETSAMQKAIGNNKARQRETRLTERLISGLTKEAKPTQRIVGVPTTYIKSATNGKAAANA